MSTTTHESIRRALAQVEAEVAVLAEAGLEQELLDLTQAELAELRFAANRLLDRDAIALANLATGRSPAWRAYRTRLGNVRELLDSLG